MDVLRLQYCTVDLRTRLVQRPDGTVRLSPTEALLLAYLASHAGALLTREQLLVDVWGYHPDVRSRTADVTVHRLRHKIEADPKLPVHVCTEAGGYRFHYQGQPIDRDGHAVVVCARPVVDWDAGRQEVLSALSAMASEARNLGPDGLLVSWDHTDSALDWAVEARSAGPVAIGLSEGRVYRFHDPHTGQIIVGGQAVRRAQDLAAVARPGQILANNGPGRPLGRFRIGNPPQDLPLVELAPSGGPRAPDAQPARSRVAEPSSPLFGRSEDRRRVDSALQRHRVIQLVGLSGVGKTRLALSVAAGRPDAWFVAVEKRSLDSALADIFGTVPQHGLLVLDAAEHLDSAALAGLPGALRILLTSRVPLDVDDTRVLPLDGLAIADAVELFRERCPIPATPEQARTVVEKLDGNPGAIELTASWGRLLQPAAIAARLDTHSPLATVVAASWDLLEESLRQAVRRLGVFVGPAPPGLVLDVCDVDITELERLLQSALVIRSDAGVQLRRDVATIAGAPDPETCHRHARRMVRTARGWLDDGREAPPGLWAELVAARARQPADIELARVIARVARNSLRPNTEVLPLLDDAIAATSDPWLEAYKARFLALDGVAVLATYLERVEPRLTGPERVWLHAARGQLLQRTDDVEGSVDAFVHAIEMLAARGDRRGAARLRQWQGHSLLALGRLDEGRLHIEQGLAELERFGDLLHASRARVTLARIAIVRGEPGRALAVLDGPFQGRMRAQASEVRGQALTLLGRYDEARTVLVEAMELFGDSGDIGSVGACQNALGSLCRREGDFDRANAWYEMALVSHRAVQGKRPTAPVQANRALCRLLTGRVGAAAQAVDAMDAPTPVWRAIRSVLRLACVAGDHDFDAVLAEVQDHLVEVPVLEPDTQVVLEVAVARAEEAGRADQANQIRTIMGISS